MIARLGVAALVAAWTMLAGGPAPAADRLVVTSGHQGGWDALVANFGLRKGFFKEAGLEVEIVDMDTGAPTVQAVVAGSVDLAVGVGLPGFIGAAMKGAPLKMISANFTGASDFAWYVLAKSPIRSFRDVGDQTTVAFSSNGSSSQVVAMALLEQAGVKGKPVATGNTAATLTQVMTGQVDVGYDGNGGMGIPEFVNGDVRIVATGGDLPAFRDQTVRGVVVTAATLAGRRDALARFLAAYQRTIDWMYADPTALAWFAERMKTSTAEAERVVKLIYPQSALRLGPVQHLDRSIAQAVAFKRIPQAPTEAQRAAMFDDSLAPSAP
ncbi:MAG: ABC transporter substrate-binding protein [Dongiaceae bacterium]